MERGWRPVGKKRWYDRRLECRFSAHPLSLPAALTTSGSLATRLIQASRRFYLVEAIPQQVVRLFLRNVRVHYIRHHIGCGDELAPLQVPEVDILRALLQAGSRR